MQTAKRFYVYAMSGIGLGVLVAGVATLAHWVFLQVGIEPVGPFGTAPIAREQLSLAGALVIVGGVVWGIHWWFAQRSVRADRPDGDAERQSALRAFYFAAVLGALLVWASTTAFGLLTHAVYSLAGRPDYYSFDPAGALAGLLTAGLAFGYHSWVRITERDAVVLRGAAAWWTRLYRHVAAFVGGAVGLSGAVGLVELATGRAVAGISTSPSGPWPESLANPTGTLVVGAVIWAGHAFYSARLPEERTTRIRLAYLTAIVAGGLAAAVVHAARALSVALAAAMDVERDVVFSPLVRADGGLLAAALGAAIAAVLFAVVAWLHRRSLRGAGGDEPGQARSASRLEMGAVAAVGLGYLATAIAQLIGVAVLVVFGGEPLFAGGSDQRAELARSAPMAIAAIPVWAWGWWRMSARRDADPVAEAGSTIRRVYLLGVIAIAIVAGIGSLGYILYELFNRIQGGIGGSLIDELSMPIGAVVVVLVVLGYHAVWLRRDMQLVGGRLIGTAPKETAGEAIDLMLVGPPEHLAEAVEELRHAVRAGYRLDVASRPHAS